MIKNIVFSGGGVKGLSYIGIYKYLKKNEPNFFKNIVSYSGCSCGSIFALFFILEPTFTQLKEFLYVDFMKHLDVNFLNFISSYGIESGNKIILLIQKIISAWGYSENITFLQLKNIKNKELNINSLCLTDEKIVFFNSKNTPNLKITDAIRMSISVPLYFTPVLHEDKYYIDAAIIDPVPSDIYETEINNTLIFKIIPDKNPDDKIINLETYITKIINCIFSKITLNKFEFKEIILNPDISVLNFSLTKKQKQKLYKYGYNIMLENSTFINNIINCKEEYINIIKDNNDNNDNNIIIDNNKEDNENNIIDENKEDNDNIN